MPGFNIAGATSAEQKSNVAEPRRKHRWLVTALGGVLQPGDLVYLQKCSRPTFKYEPAEMHHDQEVAYFAGKQTWDPISFSFYDIEQDPDVSAKLASWVSTVTMSFGDGGVETAVNIPRNYKRNGEITMVAGDGTPTEKWTLYGTWPMETNWNELDYTNSDVALIEVNVRYDRAIKVSAG